MRPGPLSLPPGEALTRTGLIASRTFKAGKAQPPLLWGPDDGLTLAVGVSGKPRHLLFGVKVKGRAQTPGGKGAQVL